MIRDFKMTDEMYIGYYASLITSAFAVSQFISGMPWGSLSDRIGRKPVVLMGLASTSIGILLFGLSKSFAWALATKIFSGLFNSNISVLKSMIAEITKNHSAAQQTRAFSLLQVTFGLGSVVGATLGGYLSKPVSRYPGLFGNLGFVTEFLLEFPYFLPCFIATSLSALCWGLGLLLMKETLQQQKYLVSTITPDSSEEQLLLATSSQNETHQYNTFNTIVEEERIKGEEKLSIRQALTPSVLAISILYAVSAFQMLYFDELLPTWSATPKDLGGLEFESGEIGAILSYAGFVMLFFQVFLLHRMTAIFGLLNLFQMALLSSTFVFFAQGLCRFLYQIPDPTSVEPNSKFWVLLGLVVCLTVKSLAQTISITTAVILLNNCVERHDTLGFINGFSQCCNAAMRTLSPTVAGYIWSRSIASTWIPLDIRAYISWGVLGVFSALIFFAGMQLNPSNYNKPRHKS
ncbi:MAG: major facilitator superfamily domain-containing protein [Benjaminiella poitrasii]|nr:MAG: major facilitator superfamily domain-containing protein [Benjaminiella poitrasii]